MDSNGSLFAIEGLLTFLIWIILLGAVFFVVFSKTQFHVNDLQHAEAEEKKIMLLERIVKDRNESNPAHGSARYNPSSKRIESNILDENLLKSVNSAQLEENGIKIQKMVIQCADQNETIVDFQADENCSQIERMVRYGEEMKKCMLKVVVCAVP